VPKPLLMCRDSSDCTDKNTVGKRSPLAAASEGIATKRVREGGLGHDLQVNAARCELRAGDEPPSPNCH